MPTFRDDVKLGTKVPLIKSYDIDRNAITEEKIKDSAVTTEKIADGAVTGDKLNSDAFDTIYDFSSKKFLPLTGGKLTGSLEVVDNSDGTGGVVHAEKFTANHSNANISRTNVEIDGSHINVSVSTRIARPASEVDITPDEISVSDKESKTTITPDTVQSSQFIKTYSDEKELLAGDGSVATPIEDDDIDNIIG